MAYKDTQPAADAKAKKNSIAKKMSNKASKDIGPYGPGTKDRFIPLSRLLRRRS